jgi:O-antigen/teichoic acid export membrane protein
MQRGLPQMAADEAAALPAPRAARAPVIRNAVLLVVAQALVAPITVLINAVAGRTLGPVAYGRMYLAVSFTTFAFLFVEWGQGISLAGKVAVHRERAGEFLGSALVWRISAALGISILLPLVCFLAGYDRDFIVILGLSLTFAAFLTISGACQDVIRGFERTDFAAASYVGWQMIIAIATISTLLLGGGLRGLLIAQVLCAAGGVVFILRMLPRMRVPKLKVRAGTIRELFFSGQAFLVFNLVLALQPMIDAAMLSKFATAEAMGWHAAARKLIGILVYPAAALGIAAYPTLCRLYAQDLASFRKTATDSMHLMTIVVVPVALGCALFPEIGIGIFSETAYGPAENNLRILSVFVLLVYFSVIMGASITSSGRQIPWTMVQFASVIVSAACDPPLIIWFQAHTGNGGLGVCVATVGSEVLMLAGGLYLLPKGILSRVMLRDFGKALLAGGVMALVGLSLTAFGVLTRAVLAVIAYVACLWVSGALDVRELRSAVTALRRG